MTDIIKLNCICFQDIYHSFFKFFAVVGPIHLVGLRLVEVVVVIWGHKAQALSLLSVGALYQLEDNSIIPNRKEEFYMNFCFCMQQQQMICNTLVSDLIVNVEVPLALILAHHP